MIASKEFFAKFAYDTAMHSRHFQELKKNRLQVKLWVANFLIKNTRTRTFMLLISQTKLLSEIQILTLEEQFINNFLKQGKIMKSLCKVPCSSSENVGQKSSHPVLLTCLGYKNPYIKTGQRFSRSVFNPVPLSI